MTRSSHIGWGIIILAVGLVMWIGGAYVFSSYGSGAHTNVDAAAYGFASGIVGFAVTFVGAAFLLEEVKR